MNKISLKNKNKLQILMIKFNFPSKTHKITLNPPKKGSTPLNFHHFLIKLSDKISIFSTFP